MTDNFVDRQSGIEHKSAESLFNAYLERFSKKVSKATGKQVTFGPLDKDGYASIMRGSAKIGINLIMEQNAVLFLSKILEIPDNINPVWYRKLLELNFLSTSDASFAINNENNTICVRAMRSIAGIDYEEFEDILQTVAMVADEWDDILEEELNENS